MGMSELELNIGGILSSSQKPVAISLLPSYPTLKNYKELLLYSEAFYQMFWNSAFQSILTILGQVIDKYFCQNKDWICSKNTRKNDCPVCINDR